MDIGDFYRIAASRLRLLLPCMALTLGLALAYSLLTPRTYTATMSFLVDPRERVPVSVDAPPMPQNPDPALVESQLRLLTSRPVLGKVVDAQRLADGGETGLFGEVAAALKSMFGGPSPDAARDTRREAAIDRLERAIAVKRSEKSYVVDVDVKGPTREKSVALAQALADAFFAAQTQLSDDVVDKERAWLERKTRELRARVERAEQEAQEYRDKNTLVVSDGRSSPEQRLKDANTALVTAQGKRADAEARYAQIKAAGSAGLAASQSDLHSPVIEKLRSDYAALARDEAYAQTVLGVRHPSYLTIRTQLESVKAQIRAEQQRIALATEREVKAARAAEQSAAALVASLEGATNRVGDKRVELNDLDHAAAALRATYEKALASLENVRRSAVSSPLAVLIDPPVAPAAPSSPKTLPALLIAIGAGLNLWIVAALIAEYRKRQARGGDHGPELGEGFYAPVRSASLGAAAVNARSHRASSNPVVFETPDLRRAGARFARAGSSREMSGPAVVAATMRSKNAYSAAIAEILDHALDGLRRVEHSPFIGVAGAAPRAGATTLALALAHEACDRGDRVLLIDRSMRSPTLTDYSEEFESAIFARSGRPARIIRRARANGGEILVLPVEGAHDVDEGLEHDDDEFDLILVDCGDLRAAARLVQRTGAVDGLIAVGRAGRGDIDVSDALARLGLDDLCLAIVQSASSKRAAQ